MTATEAMIARLRRMTDVHETAPADSPDGLEYTDEELAAYIEAYPLIDERGVAPYWWDTSEDPPQQVATVGWIPSYDLHAAAADIWTERAAKLAIEFDTSQEQAGTRNVSQRRKAFEGNARYHLSRRAAKTATLVPYPRGSGRDLPAWIGNLNDPYE